MNRPYFQSTQRPKPGQSDEATRIFNEASNAVTDWLEHGYSFEDIQNIGHMVITVARSRRKETGAR